MSQRRGEGQFVAVEVGLRHDPKVLGLAKRLRIHPQHAVGIVAAWREMVLTRGTGGGVVRGYSRAELAAFIDWQGEPARVIDALKGAGMLVTRRQTFVHPSWSATTTGSYAHHKSGERERKAAERALRREWEVTHPGEAFPGMERARELIGQSADSPRTDDGPSAPGSRTNGHKVIKDVRGHPPGPPEGGTVGAARWEAFEALYPVGIEDPATCAAILGALGPQEWEHVQYAIREQASKGYWINTPWRIPKGADWLKRGQWRRTKWKPGMSWTDKRAAKVVVLPKPSPAEIETLKSAWERRAQVKDQLRATGLKGAELESAIDQELARMESEVS